MVSKAREEGPGEGRKRNVNVTNRELSRKLESVEKELTSLGIEVVKGLGQVEASVELLATTMKTHLDFMNQQLACQETGLKDIRKELVGEGESGGLKGRIQGMETKTENVWKHVWGLWLALGGGVIGVIFSYLKKLG